MKVGIAFSDNKPLAFLKKKSMLDKLFYIFCLIAALFFVKAYYPHLEDYFYYFHMYPSKHV